MITKYYKRTYHDAEKGKFVTKLSTDIGKLIAKNETWGIPRKDGVVRGPPIKEISKAEYNILKRGWGDDSIARSVYWYDMVRGMGNDNDGFIHGIEYMDGEEVADVDWFQTKEQRDDVLKEYFANLTEEEE